MYLTQLAEALVVAINSSSPESWGGSTGTGLVVPTDVTAKFALDPFSDAKESNLDIYVIPGYIQFNRTSVRKTKHNNDRKFITVAVAAKVVAENNTPVYDVTTKASAIKLIDLKEDLDTFINNYSIPGAALQDVESEPFDELEMKDSFYIVTSVYGYDTC